MRLLRQARLHFVLVAVCLPVTTFVVTSFAPLPLPPSVRPGGGGSAQAARQRQRLNVPFLSSTLRITLVNNDTNTITPHDEYSRNGGAGQESLSVFPIDATERTSSPSSNRGGVADSATSKVGDVTTTTKKDAVKDDNDDDVGKEIFLAHLQENLAVTKQLRQGTTAASVSSSSSSSSDDASPSIASSLEGREVPNHSVLDDNLFDNGVSSEETAVAGAAASAAAADVQNAAAMAMTVKESAPAAASLPDKDATTSAIVAEIETRTTTTTTATTTTTTTQSRTAILSAAAPRVSTILKFAIPATGVWLCGPLLSLIDTSTVGILSGTIQQAALNPAVAVTDYAALLIAFLYTGTTNLIAAARDTNNNSHQNGSVTKGRQEQNKMIQRLIGALQLSTFVGAGLGAILFCFAKPLLTTIIGNADISPAVFDAAMKYVKIRAFGMPAAAVIGSAQAACLGMQDIKSPLYVLAVAAAVNFMGDMLFVGSSHPLVGGAAGAAWATVFSQYAAVGLFIHWLCNKPQNQQKLEQTQTLVNISKAKTNKKLSTARKPTKEPSFSVRGFLQGSFRARDLLKPPTRQLVQEFSPYILPVTSTQVGRVSGYVAMAHVVSSSLGTVSMAAQQVIVSLFYCLCPMADSLSLTAQSFVPAIHEKSPSKQRTQALRKTIVNFVKAGAIFGGIMTSAVACIPLLSQFFTTDQVVISMVNQVVPLLLAFFSVHGILCAAEGLLLGQKDLGFLGKMYAGYFFAMPFFMMRVKKAALSSSYNGIGLTSVWTVFVGYQAFRFSAWMIRVGFLQRRNELKTSGTSATKNAAANALSGLATAAAAAM